MSVYLFLRATLLIAAVTIAFLVVVPPTPFPSGGAGEALFARLLLWLPTLALGMFAAKKTRIVPLLGTVSRSQSLFLRQAVLGLVGALALFWDSLCTGLWVWSLARWPTSPALVLASLVLFVVVLADQNKRQASL